MTTGNQTAATTSGEPLQPAHVAALEAEQIVVSSRDGNVRISPHCYNNPEDMDRVLAGLHRHRHLLR